ncbi:MAG: 16S rRNA (cytosine(1402)-N(4))-methyltransferase RsmH [Salinisphaera sp.]|nr:16S rRNA (cytosine(1402)-N(4))-methyltransferase RsmH [Salinisphaera sp.]
MTHSHQPVMRQAALEALAVRAGGVYVDATYGRGGHCAAILDHLGSDGRLLALDRDPDACSHARRSWGQEPRFSMRQANFADLAEVLEQAGMAGRVNGILFDLGVSSPQLDDPIRGFSFLRDGPLDMRMDPASGEGAAVWLARAERADIARVLRAYADEPHAGRIAAAIVAARATEAIRTSGRLAAIVAAAVPPVVAAGRRIHPATRTFQALRIHVNGELDALRAALAATPRLLAPQGRLVAISFHSLEDRIVKRFLRTQARPAPPAPPMAPRPAPTLRVVGPAQRPRGSELETNPRARSAVLRVAEKVGGQQ